MDKATIQKVVDQNSLITNASIKFQNTVAKFKKDTKSENITQLHLAHQQLKQAVDAFELPKTSAKTSQKRKQPATTSNVKKQRSGKITLEELNQSLVDSPFTAPSREKLQQLQTNEEKLTALFRWERESKRHIIRLAFFQGYYIDQICLKKDITTKELATQTKIPQSDLQRKRQLYSKLGRFRRILYSTLPVSRLYNSITSLRVELDQLSKEEKEIWLNPHNFSHDSQGLEYCIAQWYESKKLPAKVYYACDLFNQDIREITADEVLSQIFTELRNLSKVRNIEEFKTQLHSITQNKCIIGYKLNVLNDYYRILGVDCNANDSQLKNAYHKLAKKFHPDKNKSKEAEDEFKEIKQAHSVLIDDQKRRAYDKRSVKESDYKMIIHFSLLQRNVSGEFKIPLELTENLQRMSETRVYSLNPI